MEAGTPSHNSAARKKIRKRTVDGAVGGLPAQELVVREVLVDDTDNRDEIESDKSRSGRSSRTSNPASEFNGLPGNLPGRTFALLGCLWRGSAVR